MQTRNDGMLFDDARVGTPLEEFVVPAVDDEQIGLVANQLFHQHGDAIAGVRDAAAVDDLPVATRIGRGQKPAKPADKRCAIVVGATVGRRTAQAEDAVRPIGLRGRKPLLVKESAFVGRGSVDRLAGGVLGGYEQRNPRLESDVRILGDAVGADADEGEPQLEGQKRGCDHNRGEEQFFSRRQTRNGRQRTTRSAGIVRGLLTASGFGVLMPGHSRISAPS